MNFKANLLPFFKKSYKKLSEAFGFFKGKAFINQSTWVP
jgi:hypothetical protein